VVNGRTGRVEACAVGRTAGVPVAGMAGRVVAEGRGAAVVNVAVAAGTAAGRPAHPANKSTRIANERVAVINFLLVWISD